MEEGILMRRSGLMGKLCALAVLLGLMLHASAWAMTICWVADGRYEFSKAVPRMYFFNTETQQVDVREVPFENVRLVQGKYSGMPIIAAYDPNGGTDLYACPREASYGEASPFIHFTEIDLADGELLAYSNDLMYVVEDSDSAGYFPNALDIAAIDSGNKTNIGRAPEWWSPWEMEAYPAAMCSESGAIAFWDAQADSCGVRIMNGAAETIESRYIPVFPSEMEVIPPLTFADAEHIAYAIIEDGNDGQSCLNIQSVDLIRESVQTVCSMLRLRRDENILSLLCTQDAREIYLMTGTPKAGASDGFYDALYLLRLNLHADGLSELNELLQIDYRGQRSAVNYVSPLALCFADKG